MSDPREDLRSLVGDIRTHLRMLSGFGLRMLETKTAAAEPDGAKSAGYETPAISSSTYQFGEGRRAKWEQALKARDDKEPKSTGDKKKQAHLFAQGQPEEDRADGSLIMQPAWKPNPLTAQEAQQKLDALKTEIGDCRRCRLCEERSTVVFGEGSPLARLVLAGEGPGREEDRTGRPFVGRAGQLLDRILHAMGLKREEVYICNVVKCRPPDNRTPQEDEMRTCGIFLARQLEIIHPRHVIALGATAAKYLLGTNQSMGRLRGRFFDVRGDARLLATFHPAYLLRNPAAKKDVWNDVQMVMAEMKQPVEGES